MAHDTHRSDTSRALAARLVLAEADRHPRGLFDLALSAAVLASAHVSADDAAALAAEALDRLSAD